MKKRAQDIIAHLKKHGHQAYFAGGCVRDHLRGVAPKDFDIATSAHPAEILKLYPGANTVGAHFGVILIRHHGWDFEIATFRADSEASDGRRPDHVTFTDAKEDAQRRDFTINGMFFDPEKQQVIDYVGGQKDLAKGLIRAIGDPEKRFEEDYLRLMRAIRFATVLDFEIEKNTWQALQLHAPEINQISPERIRDELDRIWLSPRRVKGFDLLVESGLMQAIFPEIITLQGCEQPPQFHPEGDVFTHTRLMLSLLPDEIDSLPLVLSVLFHDIAKPATQTFDQADQRIRFNGHDSLGAQMTADILRRLRYKNEVIEDASLAVKHHMSFINVQDMRTAKLKRMMARPTFPDELELHRVDCLGSNGMLDNYHFIQQKEQEFAAEPLIPPPLINGKDLIALGWKPGPAMGEILLKIQDLQLESTLTTHDEAIEWVKNKLI
ncbi:MAG: CCA tRNA nucleotidyltransferase [Verrucomicrobiales bacterium]|nr:CCA tRNA nucleotidyltransferase [Verrucomicrobiales bacterium]